MKPAERLGPDPGHRLVHRGAAQPEPVDRVPGVFRAEAHAGHHLAVLAQREMLVDEVWLHGQGDLGDGREAEAPGRDQERGKVAAAVDGAVVVQFAVGRDDGDVGRPEVRDRRRKAA